MPDSPLPLIPTPDSALPPPRTAPLQEIANLDQLRAVLEAQSRMPVMKTGEALLSLGLLTPEQLELALRRQQDTPDLPLGKVLIGLKLLSPEDLRFALVHKMGYPLVDVTRLRPQARALRQMPLQTAVRLKVLPLLLDGRQLVLAMEDPLRGDVVREIESSLKLKVQPVLARAEALQAATRDHYESMETLYPDFDGARLRAREFSAWQSKEAQPTSLPDFNWHTIPAPLLDLPQPSSAAASVEVPTLRMPDIEIPAIQAPAVEAPAAEKRAGKPAEKPAKPPAETGPAARPEDGGDSPLVRLIHHILGEAQDRGASGIHVDVHPGRQKVRVRLRRDGALQPYLELPHHHHGDIIARLKSMGGLDVGECDRPQAGSIDLSRFVPERRLELRVLTLPTHGGSEDVVLHLLPAAQPPLPLDQLGLSEHALERLREAIERPGGLVLCVGPAGSGRTTTLHAALAHLNTPQRKIWTVEDPVEITQPGLSQLRLDPQLGPDFAGALQTLLHTDPDVIMVGDLCDPETAHRAVEASLAGPLVLSALPSGSAPEALTRLLDMGLDPFGLADALRAVLGQRLVRRQCEHCRRPRLATPAEVDELLADWLHACPRDDARFDAETLRREWQQRFGREGRLVLHQSPGCEHCQGTGFRGRIGLHELLLVTPELRHRIRTGAPAAELRRQALREGLRTLRQDGITKVLQGLTTIAEVRAASSG